jgi:hypothetical protein
VGSKETTMHRGRHLRRFNTAGVALAALALVLMSIPSAGASTSAAAGPQARAGEARAEDTIFAKCIAAARQRRTLDRGRAEDR